MSNYDDSEMSLAVRAYVKLLRASRTVVSRLEPLLAQHGLTPTQLGVLETIFRKGPQSHRELGKRVLTSAGNMTDVIDKLETRGLVSRVRDRVDRRQVYVDLTDAGRQLISALFPLHTADITQAMAALEAEELREFVRLLRKLSYPTDTDEDGVAARFPDGQLSSSQFEAAQVEPERSV